MLVEIAATLEVIEGLLVEELAARRMVAAAAMPGMIEARGVEILLAEEFVAPEVVEMGLVEVVAMQEMVEAMPGQGKAAVHPAEESAARQAAGVDPVVAMQEMVEAMVGLEAVEALPVEVAQEMVGTMVVQEVVGMDPVVAMQEMVEAMVGLEAVEALPVEESAARVAQEVVEAHQVGEPAARQAAAMDPVEAGAVAAVWMIEPVVVPGEMMARSAEAPVVGRCVQRWKVRVEECSAEAPVAGQCVQRWKMRVYLVSVKQQG